MHIKKRIAFVLAAAVLFLSANRFQKLFARRSHVSSEKRFNALIEKNELVVALFYQKDRTQSKEMRMLAKSSQDIFNAISTEYKYEQAGVLFVGVNSTKSSMEELATLYGVHDFPRVLLFKDGVVVKDKTAQNAFLEAPFKRSDIRNFIERYIGSRIQEIKKDKDEAAKQRARERAYTYLYGSPYVGYGYYPYYYPYGPAWYASPYYGPRFGFGVGFGGGCW